MAKPKTVADLFQKEPMNWGLRGDPYLWEEMRRHFEHVPLPSAADELAVLIGAAFKALTGRPISALKAFHLERSSHGGMSSGHISPEFWRDKAVPLLCNRYNQGRGVKVLKS